MRAQAILAVLSAAVGAQAASQDATPVTGNPPGVVYKATLPDTPFFSQAALQGNIKGSISARSAPDGNGVKFTVHFKNFPKEGGPFLYHLHVNPVVDGNCTKTLGHLDPFNRGEKPPCDASAPASCQVGDLSGKYGKISADPFSAEYIDPFASLKEGDAAFFGNRSLVIHYANTTRLTCANFVKVEAPAPSGCSGQPPASSSPTGTGGTTPSQSAVPFLASAMANAASLPLMAAAVAVALFAV
ncbi:Cell surface Cu-only superoxide dismutase 5 [Tolypocladium ophioglossoides CBS 100239]|uniref:superoxide dismutase n=1 Tax=Tolypocladium ophioglossoides (strain CBS 100239) TaxID=1163406 RepID=A0A0L0NMS7_TOLOC|nr:Cell surface Cu-only superoxide dismutase 5 [Tolypocladium ophioglossoides CBS 100239]